MSSSSTSSSSLSPPTWIQRQTPVGVTSSNRRTVPVEPLNLWPSTSTWAAYSSALASLSLGQLNGETSPGIKYPPRCSPLTPTTPTYSPSFSPQAAAINSFGVHPLMQPDSPHSVTDVNVDYPSAFPLDFCTTNGDRSSPTSSSTPKINNNNKRLLQHAGSLLVSQQKRSKSFTIDAILGLEELAASCYESVEKHMYSSQGN